jgi:predicted nuclease of predicted toxin-antitoxin system
LKGILLDENVPKNISFNPHLSIIYATSLGPSNSDTDLWRYARDHDLVIVTKDADFSNRIMLSTPPPWIVHLRFGNVKLNEFHKLIGKVWPQIEQLIPQHKLIQVFHDRIEAVRG